MAIQSNETLVTKGDLKTLYTDKILPYLGGNMMMQTGVNDYYSEDEKVVGIWTDGKPVYQKTIVTNTGSSGNTTYSIASWNIDKIINYNGVIEQIVNEKYYYPNIFYNADSTYHCNIYLDRDNNKVLNIRVGSGYYNYDIYITIQYTKTTDTASSALTTPGCYDLNRPDLWPANKEIFFGNGLYGQRFTGKITAAGSTWIGTTLLSAGTPAIHIVNWGGSYCYDTNSRAEIPVGSTWSNADNYNNGIDNMTINGNALVFGSISGGTRNNAPYNIWITYTK